MVDFQAIQSPISSASGRVTKEPPNELRKKDSKCPNRRNTLPPSITRIPSGNGETKNLPKKRKGERRNTLPASNRLPSSHYGGISDVGKEFRDQETMIKEKEIRAEMIIKLSLAGKSAEEIEQCVRLL